MPLPRGMIEVMDLTYVDLVDISYQQQNRKDTPYIILELYNKLRSGDVEMKTWKRQNKQLLKRTVECYIVGKYSILYFHAIIANEK